jgi:hypothetical protein
MTQETTKSYPLWIPPTYLEEGSFEPSQYSVEDWRQAEEAIGELVGMATAFDNQCLILALWHAQDRAKLEVERAKQRARRAS